MLMAWVLYSLLLYFLGRALMPGWITFMENHRLTDSNYNGERIPTAGGLFIVMMFLIHSLVVQGIAYGKPAAGSQGMNLALSNVYTLGAVTVAFLGFLDDTVGNKTPKGFTGHWRLWKEHRVVSTGTVKAGGVAIAAMLFVLRGDTDLSAPWGWVALQWLCIVLAANGINLLDTRPGRAFKGFGALYLLAIAVMMLNDQGHRQDFLVMSLPVLVSMALLLGADLKGQIMLGDTGANLLGFVLGCWIVQATGWKLQLLLLVGFILLHAITWRHSLSRLIDNHRWLSWLDSLGRESGPKQN
ncbi:hypothetical protein [Paenibacillus sp. 32352]|uniref:hypothetical protein n=1 Tax=Paenibacillus sp. 32352 TaxID=1969111 RepID=UPI0009AD44F0|nr:hypothetical protein [Paenibacillus sp. 32352]